jgi:hypothetical protein
MEFIYFDVTSIRNIAAAGEGRGGVRRRLEEQTRLGD